MMSTAGEPRSRPYPLLDKTAYRLWLSLRRLLPDPRLALRTTFRAAKRALGISLTVFFGLVSVILFALSEVRPGSQLPIVGLEVGSLGRLGLLVLGLGMAYVLSGAAALKLLSPDQYAYAVISGSGEKDVLRMISERSRRLCIRFVLATRYHAALSEELLSVADDNFDPRQVVDGPALADKLRDITARHERVRRRRLKRTQDRVHKLLRQEEQEIRRLEAMKTLAASELDIPTRRLSDQIIQFSPSMFRDAATKYEQNLKEMIAMLPDMRTEAEVARFCGLVRQNRWLEDRGRTRALRLKEMIRFRPLYSYLRAFAATHSTSGSLQVYVRSFAEVLRWGRRLPRKYRHLGIWQRLRFLHRKQRAHPGFDLHELLGRLCEELERELTPRGATVTAANRKILVHLQRIRGVLSALEAAAHTGGPTAVPEPFAPKLAALHHVPAYVSRSLADSRTRIARRFLPLLAEWSRPGPYHGLVYFVTHGYSKTVRELLRESFAQPDGPLPVIFLLTGRTPADEFDTRRMKLELKQHLPETGYRLAAGHADLLLGLLRSHDRVLLVEGAECFDIEGRVVHPRATAEHVSELIRRLDDQGVPNLFTVVAESYKRQERPLSQTSFFADHFDRVAVYPPDSAHLIVSNDATRPDDWQSVIRRRLHRQPAQEPATGGAARLPS